MKAVARARSVGGSTVITLSKKVVRGDGIAPGQVVEIMGQQTITIQRKEYERLKGVEKSDQKLLQDMALGIKDILEGKVKEV